MLPPVATLLYRNLLVDLRRAGTLLTRLGLCAVMLLALYATSQTPAWLGAPGLLLLNWVVWGAFLFITLSGFSIFATAITEEREAGTLPLLLMTELSPSTVLIGKWGARLAGVIVMLLVLFPFALLTIPLGGVSLLTIASQFCTLLGYLVLISSIGLFVSTRAQRSATAFIASFALVVGYLIGSWFLIVIPRFGGASASALAGSLDWLEIATPWAALVGSSWGMRQEFQWEFFAFATTAGLLLTLISAFLFHRNPRHLQAELGGASTRRRSGRVGSYAIAWKEWITGFRGPKKWLAQSIPYLLVGLCIATGVIAFSSGGIPTRDWSVFLVITAAFGFSLSVAYASSRLFQREIEQHTWATLHALPKSTARLAIEKVLGCWPLLLPPIVLIGTAAAVEPWPIEEFAEELLFDDEGVVVWLGWTFFMLLVVDCSLWARWGAIPVAGLLFGLICMVGGFGDIDEEGFLALFIVATPLMLLRIHSQLRRLAAA